MALTVRSSHSIVAFAFNYVLYTYGNYSACNRNVSRANDWIGKL